MLRFQLISLDGDDTLRTRHLDDYVHSVYYCHELEKQRPLKDVVIANVEACYLKG
jgi:hypothetical protein